MSENPFTKTIDEISTQKITEKEKSDKQREDDLILKRNFDNLYNEKVSTIIRPTLKHLQEAISNNHLSNLRYFDDNSGGAFPIAMGIKVINFRIEDNQNKNKQFTVSITSSHRTGKLYFEIKAPGTLPSGSYENGKLELALENFTGETFRKMIEDLMTGTFKK